VVAALRLLLVASALAIVYIEPTRPERNVAATYAVLSAYTAVSLVLYLRSLRAPIAHARWWRWDHWSDIAWLLVLLALTGGASSLFFVLFFFPILVASFRSGFAVGMAATLGAAIACTAVGLVEARGDSALELNRLLLRAVSLLVIGFVISSRGGFEALLRGRLALLKEIGRLSNPRLGTDRTIAASLERLREFCDADDCLLVLADASSGEARLRRASRDDPERARREDPLPAELARLLLALPPDHAMIHPGAAAESLLGPRARQYDVVRGQPVPIDSASAHAEWFTPNSFITVPVLGRAGTIGRLFLASAGDRLRSTDIEFLLQVVDCLLPLIENIRLVDRLAASAASEERQKIARDVHDSVIQPYIGLELGLMALLRQAESAGLERDDRVRAELLAGLQSRLRRLTELMHGGVAELRSFVSRLRAGGEREGSFAAIVSSYARRFAEITGIDVRVEIAATPELDANDRLCAELFQLIAEGLSNVRRHSEGKVAIVRVVQTEEALRISIQNDGSPGRSAATFSPRSIADRARSLQGWTTVETLDHGGCIVTVGIPL
jgi:signal transduction histidine kinase